MLVPIIQLRDGALRGVPLQGMVPTIYQHKFTALRATIGTDEMKSLESSWAELRGNLRHALSSKEA